jgi:hypothetical protein
MIEAIVILKGLDIATKIIAMETIQFTTKVKNKDIVAGTFGARIIKKFNQIYPDMTLMECNNTLALLDKCQDYVTDEGLSNPGSEYNLAALTDNLTLVDELTVPSLIPDSHTNWVAKYS